MTRTLGSLVDHALASLSLAALSQVARERLVAFWSQFDERLSGLIMLEMPLVAADRSHLSADLSFLVWREEVGVSLAGSSPDPGVPIAWFDEPAWQAVRAIARQWIEPTTAIGQAGSIGWLEFDHPASGVDTRSPGLFLPLRDHGVADRPAPEHVLAMTEAVVAAFRGSQLREIERRAVARLARSGRFKLVQVGFFAGRPCAPFRLEISCNEADLGGALSDVGWDGSSTLLVVLATLVLAVAHAGGAERPSAVPGLPGHLRRSRTGRRRGVGDGESDRVVR